MAIIPGQEAGSNISFDPSQQKQKTLLFLLLLVIFATAAVFYFGSANKGSSLPGALSGPGGAETPANGSLIQSLKNASLDIPVLKNQKFRSLISPGKLPITIDQNEKGRENPFQPF